MMLSSHAVKSVKHDTTEVQVCFIFEFVKKFYIISTFRRGGKYELQLDIT